MNFASLLFLLFFLPLFLLFYFTSSSINTKNNVILIFSLIFYCYGGVKYLILLLAMCFAGWFFGIIIQRHNSKKERKPFLIISVVIFIGVLCFFKYTGFFLGSFGSLIGEDSALLHLALPLGISFYTFKLISYVADIYNDRIKAEENYLTVLTYVSMFQTCVAGPIVRYSTIQNEMHSRKRLYSDIANGAYRCCIGLAKKAIFANRCGTLAEQLLPIASDISSVPVSGVWLGSFCYMLQIYLDFAAYSDMAIGFALICGFHFEENFNYPYIAVSVKDFWRRWHISLSTFFRDYVYIPLGGNRVSANRTIVNLLVVWALTGLWHGSSWNYILWGLYFFVFIVLENKYLSKKSPVLSRPLSHLITLLIIFFGWLLFRFENFSQLGTAFAGLFGLNHNPATSSAVTITFANNIFFIIIAILGCTPIFKKLMEFIQHRSELSASPKLFYIIRIVLCVVCLFISVAALIGNSYSPFLYNQF